MESFDIILLVLLGFGGVKGFQQGFIVAVFSFFAFFVGLFIALEFTIPVSLYLFGSSSFFDIGAVVVFIALFILLSFLIKLGAKAIKNIVDFTFFGTLDNAFGAVAGIVKSAFVLSIVFWVFDSVGFDLVSRYSDGTVIFPYIVGIGPTVFEWLSGLLPFIEDLIDMMKDLPGSKDSVLTLLVGKFGITKI
ncbi:MAG: CvpA family protein [Cyclobacteriaceae bacterium]